MGVGEERGFLLTKKKKKKKKKKDNISNQKKDKELISKLAMGAINEVRSSFSQQNLSDGSKMLKSILNHKRIPKMWVNYVISIGMTSKHDTKL